MKQRNKHSVNGPEEEYNGAFNNLKGALNEEGNTLYIEDDKKKLKSYEIPHMILQD